MLCRPFVSTYIYILEPKLIQFEDVPLMLTYEFIEIGSSAIANNVLRPTNVPDMADMKFVFKGRNGDVQASLNESEKIWTHSDFNSNANTVIVITGWNSNVNITNVALDVLYLAYKQRDVNFVVRRIHNLGKKSGFRAKM